MLIDAVFCVVGTSLYTHDSHTSGFWSTVVAVVDVAAIDDATYNRLSAS